jgi:hypothetical protein
LELTFPSPDFDAGGRGEVETVNPLTDDLKQAFERAVYSFNDWRHHGGPERLVQIGSNPKHFTIGEVCNLVLNFDNERLPDDLYGHVLRLRVSETKRQTLVENLGTDRTYHAGARFLRGLILNHYAKETGRK